MTPTIALVLLVTSSWAQQPGTANATGIEYPREDPTKIRTTEACRECHAAEYDVWRNTHHAKGFKTLHREEAAQAIANNMDVSLIKRESVCLNCHYTPILVNGSLRAESGVSCESCHGAGADWINVHNDYGGKGFTAANETPEHRANRIETSRKLGMRRPSDLYQLMSRCFQCHTVPDERLVNVGGHGTGSADFELVARTNGEIRHNFLQSFLHGDGTVNAERSMPNKRVMYVLGRVLDIEYSLRGIAAATEQQRYFKAMSSRLRKAIGEVRAIQSRVAIPELEEIIALTRAVKAVPNNQEALVATANKVGELVQKFITKHDAAALATLDPLVLGQEAGDSQADSADAAGADAASADAASPDRQATTGALDAPGGTASPPSTGTGSGSASSGTSGGATASNAKKPSPGAKTESASSTSTSTRKTSSGGVSGDFKTFVHPRSQFKTIGPGKCSSCHRHEKQSNWWYADAHFAAADSFLAGDPKNIKIARLYGLDSSKMTRGDQICMDCHGTVVSGKEKRDATDGVSCESCHGPAASYLEPHQEGEPELGSSRPGYIRALEMGMSKLRDSQVMAARCVSCHYITEERLLSAGHPSGSKFDYIKGLEKTKHWDHDLPADGALKAVFAKILETRGPVPKVTQALSEPITSTAPDPNSQPSRSTSSSRSEESGSSAPGTAPDGSTVSQAGAVDIPKPRRNQDRPQAPAPRPVDPESIPQPPDLEQVDLSPFPEIDETTPIEEVLLILKHRLEQLHEEVYSNPKKETGKRK